ncbi:hypothetical protein [Coleofasciculus sp.]
MIHRTLLEIDNPSRYPSAYLIVEALVEADLLTYDSKRNNNRQKKPQHQTSNLIHPTPNPPLNPSASLCATLCALCVKKTNLSPSSNLGQDRFLPTDRSQKTPRHQNPDASRITSLQSKARTQVMLDTRT